MSAGRYLREALWYAREMRWLVLPLRPGQKVPLLAAWQREASCDLATVAGWWEATPAANVGVATGPGSGVWVLDIDPRHGGDVSLEVLVTRHGPLPETVEQVTGGGGRQLFFRWPDDGRVVRNAADLPVVPDGPERTGIDVRGDGGQVVVPPSVHPSGGTYVWQDETRPGVVEVAAAPAWLLDMVASLPADVAAATAAERPGRGDDTCDASIERITAGCGWMRDCQQALNDGRISEPEYYACLSVLVRCQNGDRLIHDWSRPHPAYQGPAYTDAKARHAYSAAGPVTCRRVEDELRAKACHACPHRGKLKSPIVLARQRPQPGADLPHIDDDGGGDTKEHTSTAWPPRGTGTPTADEDLFSVAGDADHGAPGKRRPAESPGDRYYPLNDSGNAERFRVCYQGRALYCHTWQTWLWWTGTHWEVDQTQQVFRWVADAVSQCLKAETDAVASIDKEEAKKVRRFQRSALNKRSIENAMAYASAMEIFSTTAESWDASAWLFTVRNGTIDLQTGELLPHDQAHHITRYCDLSYKPGARSERWERYLSDLTGGDCEIEGFLCRAAGYSMSGSTREESVFMLAGEGGTGKSVLTTAMLAILGSYGDVVPFEAFLTSNNNQRKYTLAKVSQCRLIVSEESGEGRRFAADAVKLVTGGTPIEAEAKFKSPFTYIPRYKVWFVTNECPRVSDSDSGFWRRLKLVRCDTVVQDPDLDLKDFIARDPAIRTAILAWMVRGAIEYADDGLAPPKCVLDFTQLYRTEQDPIKDFLDARTYWPTADESPGFITRAELYQAYVEWHRLNDSGRPLSSRAFCDRMRARGAEDCYLKSDTHNRHVRGWKGVRLLAPDEDEDPTTPQMGGIRTHTDPPHTSHTHRKRKVCEYNNNEGNNLGAVRTQTQQDACISHTHTYHGNELNKETKCASVRGSPDDDDEDDPPIVVLEDDDPLGIDPHLFDPPEAF